MRIVYITARNSEEAKKISTHLLKKRLIACANIFPIESMYWWQNKIQEDLEFVILGKTADDTFPEIEREMKALHGSDVPAIYSWEADKVSGDYEKWLKKEVKNK